MLKNKGINKEIENKLRVGIVRKWGLNGLEKIAGGNCQYTHQYI